MMSMIFYLLFLIPLCFMELYWLMQFLFFLGTFIFMFMISFNWMYIKLSYTLGLDLLSYSLSLLSFWICSLMILASTKIYKLNYYKNFFLFIMVVLLLSLLMTFFTMNLFVFYLFFEISLIPTLILIMGWGYQPERIEAGMYLLFYTMVASLPMLIGMFCSYKKFYSLEFYFLGSWYSILIYLSMIMVFLMKMPMFLVHLWLPKAHVEASISGSMILAGVMLKLGGYGIFRVMKMFLSMNYSVNTFFITISLLGSLIISFICMSQSDLKALIAYSSVSHMSVALGSMMTLNMFGMWGALVLMISHGLCSSGLFCLANILYERTGSRSLYMNKGMMNILPSLALWWFLLSVSNMAAPPSLNLYSEILLINSLISFSNFLMTFLSLVSFFGSAYSLYMYSFSQHGNYFLGLYSFSSIKYIEYLLLTLHWMPLNLLILKADFLTLWI